MVDEVGQDLRYGLRLLRSRPGLAITAIGSIAVGIGASVSMFLIVNAALIRPLPVDSPEELVFLFTTTPENPYSVSSYPDYLDYRDHSNAFRGLAAYSEVALSLSDHGSPEELRGLIASGNFFEVLGVLTQVGRVFTPEDDRVPGRSPCGGG